MSPQLLVANLERSLAYYCTELGFAIDFRYEDFYAGISSQGYSIHLKLGNPYRIEDPAVRRLCLRINMPADYVCPFICLPHYPKIKSIIRRKHILSVY